uniref:Uncharacterized protein n=1 Tax=Trypanosoma vivax (strain Y486) TaxID=1055687 RepID=G0U498_TRYVY|nr:conserved hypothetical protein [Trypanosoma vivax Y486]
MSKDDEHLHMRTVGEPRTTAAAGALPADLIESICPFFARAEVVNSLTDVFDRAQRCLNGACMVLCDRVDNQTLLDTAVADGGSGVTQCSFRGIEVCECEGTVSTSPGEVCMPNVEVVQTHLTVAYSSEDGSSLVSSDLCFPKHARFAEGDVGNVREANIVIRFIIGIAFSCPCVPLSRCFQLVVSNLLETSPCCQKLRRIVGTFLSPLDTIAVMGTHGMLSELELSGKFVYYVNGAPVVSDLHDALQKCSTEETGMAWYVSPLPTTALPILDKLFSGELSSVLEVLHKIATAEHYTPSTLHVSSLSKSSSTRRSLRTVRNQANSNDDISSAFEVESSGKGISSEKEEVKRTLWEALSRCGFVVTRCVVNEQHEILYRVFTDIGEVPQYYNVLSTCPDVLRTHHRTFRYVMFEDGPMPIHERLMVAFMTACRQKCGYLACRFSALLLRFGENQQSRNDSVHGWLQHGPPSKLQALQRFIAIATHVPWQISDAEIHTAMAAGWSVPSLMQVSTIVAETLSLCSFVMGIFVQNDLWAVAALPPSLISALLPNDVAGSVHRDETNLTLYTGVDDIVSEDRVKGSLAGTTALCSGDFNWHEHGGALMEQYYPGAAALLNDEFYAFAAVTHRLHHSDCVGLTNPKYSPSYAFQLLRFYVQYIIGFLAEGYPYSEINKVLRRSAKLIVQTCTMRPETISRSQLRLWKLPSGEPGSTLRNASYSPMHLQEEGLRGHVQTSSCVDEQKQQLVESLNRHRAPFTLQVPGDVAARQPQPPDDLLDKVLHLHEEWLVFLLLIATMEARKEGLLTILLHPLWKLLNNM